MTKIAILTESDSIWALSMWERTLPTLQAKGYEVVGICCVSARVASNTRRGLSRAFEHLFQLCGILGVLNIFRFAVFQFLHVLCRIFKGRPTSCAGLAKQYGIAYHYSLSPNDAKSLQWFEALDVDIIIMSQGHILKKPLLDIPRLGVINRHAGLLPQNKGLMPYIWAIIEGIPQGISYHVATQDIDAGAVLYQKRNVPEASLASMIAFYAYVHMQAADMWCAAIESMINGEALPAATSSHAPRSLPTRLQMIRFHRKAGCIMRNSDFKYAFRLVL